MSTFVADKNCSLDTDAGWGGRRGEGMCWGLGMAIFHPFFLVGRDVVVGFTA